MRMCIDKNEAHRGKFLKEARVKAENWTKQNIFSHVFVVLNLFSSQRFLRWTEISGRKHGDCLCDVLSLCDELKSKRYSAACKVCVCVCSL